MSISSRIKEAREKQGLSRAELAKEIGVSASSISNYENGISSPKDSVLYALIQTLHVDANFIFQDEMRELQEKSPAPEEAGDKDIFMDELMANYKALNREGQRKLIDYSKDLISGGRYAAIDEEVG